MTPSTPAPARQETADAAARDARPATTAARPAASGATLPAALRDEPTVPPLVRRADLDPVAWQVLLRDGDLVPVRDGVARPAAVPDSPAVRAASLAALVPARCAAARETAAWVHLGGRPPERVHVLGPPGGVPGPVPGRTASEAALPARDVLRLAGVAVTTPRRTALDLLTRAPPDDAERLVRALVAAGLDPRAVRTDVAAASGRRGVRGAAAVLRRLAP